MRTHPSSKQPSVRMNNFTLFVLWCLTCCNLQVTAATSPSRARLCGTSSHSPGARSTSWRYYLIILSSELCHYHYLIKAQFFLPSVDGDLTEGKPPINVKFEIPYFTTSGIQVKVRLVMTKNSQQEMLLQVRYLKIIEKSGYQALPWVRYITQNGDYQLRTQWALTSLHATCLDLKFWLLKKNCKWVSWFSFMFHAFLDTIELANINRTWKCFSCFHS